MNVTYTFQQDRLLKTDDKNTVEFTTDALKNKINIEEKIKELWSFLHTNKISLKKELVLTLQEDKTIVQYGESKTETLLENVMKSVEFILKNLKPTVTTNYLCEADLSSEVTGEKYIQYGEINGTDILWLQPQYVSLKITSTDDKPQLETSDGKSFAGFEKNYGIYLERDDILLGQTTCMRILNDEVPEFYRKKVPFFQTAEGVQEKLKSTESTGLKDNNPVYETTSTETLPQTTAITDNKMSLLKEFIAELPKNLKSNKNLKNYIKEFYKKHNIEQDDASESASREPLTVAMINAWAAAPSKGGLSMPDLKAKAEEYGVDVKGLKKAEIKDALLELAVPAAEVVKSKEPVISAEPVDFTAEMVEKWTVKELKENAKRCGVDIKANAKKDEIKEAMLAVALPGSDKELEELTVDLIDSWMAAPKKGGLSMTDLKAKAKEYGVDASKMKKKDDVKEALLKKVVEEVAAEDATEVEPEKNEAEDASEELDNGVITLKKEQVNGWFKNLKIGEIRKKAVLLGIDESLTKPQLKKLFLERCVNSGSTSGGESDGEIETCSFVCSKGPNKGKQCESAAKENGYCNKHKKSSKSPPKKASKSPPKLKSATTGQCKYVKVRGKNSGEQCTRSTKNGAEFCSTHGKGKSSEEASAESTDVVIIRNEELDVWQIEDTPLLVKSPTNKVVYAYVKDDKIEKKLTAEIKELAKSKNLKTI